MTHTDFWYSLINHGVPKHEIDKLPTEFLFALYKWENKKEKDKHIGSWQEGISARESISKLGLVCRP